MVLRYPTRAYQDDHRRRRQNSVSRFVATGTKECSKIFRGKLDQVTPYQPTPADTVAPTSSAF